MKRLIFVILKILESTAFVFVPYFAGHHFCYLLKDPQYFVVEWFLGLLWVVLVISCSVLLYILITVASPNFIKLNKEWAEKIHNRFKSPSGGE